MLQASGAGYDRNSEHDDAAIEDYGLDSLALARSRRAEGRATPALEAGDRRRLAGHTPRSRAGLVEHLCVATGSLMRARSTPDMNMQ